MKKSLLLLLSVSLFLFSGCGAKNDQPISVSEDPAFTEMMNSLSGYEPGTAGSSLKVYIAACGILNFSQQYETAEAEQFKVNLDDYLKKADEQTLQLLLDSRDEVQTTANEILTKGTTDSQIAELLETAGNPNQYDSYDQEKYQAVITILNETLVQYATEK